MTGVLFGHRDVLHRLGRQRHERGRANNKWRRPLFSRAEKAARCRIGEDALFVDWFVDWFLFVVLLFW